MRRMTERYVEKGNRRRHLFSGSLIFRIMLQNRGKFSSLMNYHSSAKLALAEFMIKWINIKLFSLVFNYCYLEYAGGYSHADGHVFPDTW